MLGFVSRPSPFFFFILVWMAADSKHWRSVCMSCSRTPQWEMKAAAPVLLFTSRLVKPYQWFFLGLSNAEKSLKLHPSCPQAWDSEEISNTISSMHVSHSWGRGLIPWLHKVQIQSYLQEQKPVLSSPWPPWSNATWPWAENSTKEWVSQSPLLKSEFTKWVLPNQEEFFYCVLFPKSGVLFLNLLYKTTSL